jgi:hypothetical protein
LDFTALRGDPPSAAAIYTVDYDEAAVASHEDMLKKRHEQGDTFSVICGYKYFRVGA